MVPVHGVLRAGLGHRVDCAEHRASHRAPQVETLVATGCRVLVTSRPEGVQLDRYREYDMNFVIFDLCPLDNAQHVTLAHQRLAARDTEDTKANEQDTKANELAKLREPLATKLIAVSEIRCEHDEKSKELFSGFRSVEAHGVRNLATSNMGTDVHALYDHRLDGDVVATAEPSIEPFEPTSQYSKDIGVSGAILAQACEPKEAQPPLCFVTPVAMWDYIKRSTDQTYVIAERLGGAFDAFVEKRVVECTGIGDGTNKGAAPALPEAKVAPLKDPVRLLEKMSDAGYGLPQVQDVLRASILCTSAAQVRAAVADLLRDLDEAPDMTTFDDDLAARFKDLTLLASDVEQAKRQWDQLAQLGVTTATTTTVADDNCDGHTALVANVRDATAELDLALKAMGRVVRHLGELGALPKDPSTVDAANAVFAQLTAAQTLRAAASGAQAHDEPSDVNAMHKELRRWAGRARAHAFLAEGRARAHASIAETGADWADEPAAAARLLFRPALDNNCLVVRVLELKHKFARLDLTHFRFAHFVLLLCKGATVMPVELQIHRADIKRLNDERGGHGHYETLRVRAAVCCSDCGGRTCDASLFSAFFV